MSIPVRPPFHHAPQPGRKTCAKGDAADGSSSLRGQPARSLDPEPELVLSTRGTVLLALVIVNVLLAGMTVWANFSVMVAGSPSGGLFFLLGLVLLALGIPSAIFLPTDHPARKRVAIAFGALLVATYVGALLLDLGSYLSVPKHGLLADVTRAEHAMGLAFDAALLVLGVATAVLALVLDPITGPEPGRDAVTGESARPPG